MLHVADFGTGVDLCFACLKLSKGMMDVKSEIRKGKVVY